MANRYDYWSRSSVKAREKSARLRISRHHIHVCELCDQKYACLSLACMKKGKKVLL